MAVDPWEEGVAEIWSVLEGNAAALIEFCIMDCVDYLRVGSGCGMLFAFELACCNHV